MATNAPPGAELDSRAPWNDRSGREPELIETLDTIFDKYMECGQRFSINGEEAELFSALEFKLFLQRYYETPDKRLTICE